MEDPKTPGRPPDLVREIVQGYSASRRTERPSWSSDIIESALLEASRIQLDAFKSGVRTYEELVKAGQVKAEEIVAEARREAKRMIADAQYQASAVQAQRGWGDSLSDAAVEALRQDIAAFTRLLQRGMGGAGFISDVPSSVLTEHLSASPGAGTIPPASTSPQAAIIRDASTSGQHPDDGTQSVERTRGDSTERRSGSWVPPEWISAE
jgi:hypothetical protein